MLKLWQARWNWPIKIGNTAYGRFEVQQKRDAKGVYKKMSHAKKEPLKMKLAEIDEAETNDGQLQPPTPTHV